jgi:hypothetical protein
MLQRKYQRYLKEKGLVQNGVVNVTKSNYYTVYPLKRKIHQLDPIAWYVERWGGKREDFIWSAYPEYKNHSWDGTEDPLYTAWSSVAQFKDIAVSSATAQGKTYLVALMALWFLDVFPNSLVVVNASTFSQLRISVFKEIKKFLPKFKVFYPECRYSENLELNIYSEDVKFINGSYQAVADKRQLKGLSPQVAATEEVSVAASGLHEEYMLIICDEASNLHPALLKAFQNTKTYHTNVLACLGNPHNEGDMLHYFGSLPTTVSIRASAYDHPNIVTGKDVIKGAVTQKSVDERMLEYGEEHPVYLARVRGMFPKEVAGSLMKRWDIENCYRLHKKKREISLEEHYTVCGIDVANSREGDLAAASIIEDSVVTYLHGFQCEDANFIARWLMEDDANIYELIEQYEDGKNRNYNLFKAEDYDLDDDQIMVDAGGPGVATINTFSEYGYDVQNFSGGARPIDAITPKDSSGKPLYYFYNLRSQAFFLLMQDILKERISFDIPKHVFEELVKQLVAFRSDVNYTSRNFKLESKEQTKRLIQGKSPDLADALMMANLCRHLHIKGGLGDKYFGIALPSSTF